MPQNVHGVAHHLQLQAHSISGAQKDAFARAAYNRYYYACYLLARSALEEMQINADLPHSNIPDYLNGTIKKTIRREKQKTLRNEDLALRRLLDDALRAIPEIVKIMTDANAARVVADYKPDIKVEFKSANRFTLNSIEITTAHSWFDNLQLLTKSLRSAWRQIND